ncbi:MAG: hypothetical protein K9W46_12825 [Candidatus Heimdallarchaeum endolithica]|uniref:Uncharacterized protein n=1 Tax=Candidatus Heimdallarchaeum endolithica TaxID=2876572 RepID=A0A9Y1FN01_9ARCH|nr:MAG: hypothetical protein K9W46_12825 [Candidatus Heimdallarchaeum endolithica]
MSNSDSNTLKEFKDLYFSIKDNFEQLPVLLLGLIEYTENLEKEQEKYIKKLKDKEAEIEKLSTETKEKLEKVNELEQKNKEYEEKLNNLEESMSKFRTMYEEIAAEKAKEMDIEELLAIYSILFENVFAANPHTKIILLLQGTDKEEWTREEIVKTTGITPAAVMKALYDLRNNGIVDIAEDNKTVRLVQRLV